MLLNQIQQEQFRREYAVMYRNEEAIQQAMERFNPEFHVFPGIDKNPSHRRNLVNRLITGNKEPTDPYRPASIPFNFEDIKYFLGDSSIDVVLYGSYSPNVFMKHFSDSEMFSKNYDTGNLAMTALQNVGVDIRKIILLAWDDTYGSNIYYGFAIQNKKFNKLQLDSPSSNNELSSKEPLESLILSEDELKPQPLIIVENRVEYGRKHDEIVDFLYRHERGIEHGNFVFSFVGERVINDMFGTRSVINQLKMI